MPLIRKTKGIAVYNAIMDDVSIAGNFKTSITLAEQHIYGRSLLGMHKSDLALYSRELTGSLGADLFDYTETALTSENEEIATSNNYPLKRGNKLYQLANHLGNVLATISDRKLGIDDVSIGTASGSPYYVYSDYYIADVANAQDYYPFGMEMPGRTYANVAFADGEYRYGFNGMEGDDEPAGQNNTYDFGSRIYDARTIRFLSVDPIAKFLSSHSDYHFAFNCPILMVDKDGMIGVVVVYVTYENGEQVSQSGEKLGNKTLSTEALGKHYIGDLIIKVHQEYVTTVTGSQVALITGVFFSGANENRADFLAEEGYHMASIMFSLAVKYSFSGPIASAITGEDLYTGKALSDVQRFTSVVAGIGNLLAVRQPLKFAADQMIQSYEEDFFNYLADELGMTSSEVLKFSWGMYNYISGGSLPKGGDLGSMVSIIEAGVTHAKAVGTVEAFFTYMEENACMEFEDFDYENLEQLKLALKKYYGSDNFHNIDKWKTTDADDNTIYRRPTEGENPKVNEEP